MIIRFKKILSVGRRKHQIRDSSLRSQLYRLSVILFGVLCLHALAMMALEGMGWLDAIWLTLTSATTVGYGDLSAETPWGRVTTMVLLYGVGIAILAQVAAMYFEYRQETRNRMLKGDWSWSMENHIVFLNCPEEMGEAYFHAAISQLRASGESLAQAPILIVSDAFDNGLSSRLRELDVVHVSKPIMESQTLHDASVESAHTVVILAHHPQDLYADSVTFELIYRLRDMGVKGRIVAEVVNDEKRERMVKAGANSVLRPIRAYPEMLMRAILAPGSEQVIETLFNSYGEECIRYDVPVKANWLELINRLAQADIGLPIAYEDGEGRIHKNPHATEQVDARALFVLVHEGKVLDDSDVAKLLAV